MKFRMLSVLILFVINITLFSTSIYIWDNDNGGDFYNPDSGEIIGTEFALQKAIEENGKQYEIGWVLPDDLLSYDILFIPLGKYCFGWGITPPGTVSSIQQEQIINFLNAGKSLYIESVDVASSLENTDLFEMFGVSLISHGNYTATIQNLQGSENSFTDSFILNYAYDSELDYLVDELQIAEGSALLHSQDEVLRTAYYENEYRVITSSILFGGMKDGVGNNKKVALMNRY